MPELYPSFFAMLACGFIAGRFGKRVTMGISVLLMAFGVGICAVSPVYSILFLAVMLAGVGEGVIEGLATPFVQDLHTGEEPGRYINFAHSFWSVGVLFTVLIVGFLLSAGVNWRILIGGVAMVGFFTSLIFLLPQRKGHEYPEHPEIIKFATIWKHSAKILKIPRFWLFFTAMFLGGGGEFCLTFLVCQLYSAKLESCFLGRGSRSGFFCGWNDLGTYGVGIYYQTATSKSPDHRFRNCRSYGYCLPANNG